MAKLGMPSAFAGAVSRDVFGDQLWRATLDAGLDDALHPAPRQIAAARDRAPARPAQLFLRRRRQRRPAFRRRASCRKAGSARLPLGALRRHQPRAPAAGGQAGRAGGDTKGAGRAHQLRPELPRADGRELRPDPAPHDRAGRRDEGSEEDLVGLLRTHDADAAFATLRGWNPDATYLYTKGAAGACAAYAATERGIWRRRASARGHGRRGRRQHRRAGVEHAACARARRPRPPAFRRRGGRRGLPRGRRHAAVAGRHRYAAGGMQA